MDIQKSKELSFDTQDFPKDVWVFDADNLDQGTEISHLMMSHAEEYTKDELLVICRQASMVIDQLRTDLTKAQAVPNHQALHDRLLVKSIREHVESHISEISVNDLFDKGWLAAMKCIQNNIDMLEAQEPAND